MNDKTWNRLKWRNRLDRWCTWLAVACCVGAAILAVVNLFLGYFGQAFITTLVAVAAYCISRWHPALVEIKDEED